MDIYHKKTASMEVKRAIALIFLILQTVMRQQETSIDRVSRDYEIDQGKELIMSTVELLGKKVELDEDGYLKDPADWSEEMANEIAREEGINELTDRHWIIINMMRNEYLEKGDAPSIRRLTKESGVPIKELYELFPKGPAKKAARIAGIAKPTGCI